MRTAEGNGPVNALDRALRDSIGELHPHLRDIELVNFKVRILDEDKGTGAVTRVLIDASDGQRVWGKIGVLENVIEARGMRSWTHWSTECRLTAPAVARLAEIVPIHPDAA